LADGNVSRLSSKLADEVTIVRMLSSSFILTSLIWACATAAIIDRRLRVAGTYLIVAAMSTVVGVMHSPLPGSAVFLPWQLSSDQLRRVLHFTAGYLLAGGLLIALNRFRSHAISTDGENHAAPHP
jgi:AGZA family xanthine/uracil permease-like MFS transporter